MAKKSDSTNLRDTDPKPENNLDVPNPIFLDLDLRNTDLKPEFQSKPDSNMKLEKYPNTHTTLKLGCNFDRSLCLHNQTPSPSSSPT